MENYIIRPSTAGDKALIMSMYEHSRAIMRADGNSNQWVNGYPLPELIDCDIKNGISYVVVNNNHLVGVFAFIIGDDPTYTKIEGEGWEDASKPYGTIHRLACAPESHGVGTACIDWCRQQTGSLRIDTHKDNRIMQHLVSKWGFKYRGIIHIADGTPRLAYQMLSTGKLCTGLLDYLNSNILPQYENFDSAHRRDHADAVIRNSIELAKHYDVDLNMVYTVAAYHDTGLCNGRETHHIKSGEILREDKELLRWFSQNQLKTMGEAVEDHRASLSGEPRSIYGKIVAEADRDIDPLKIIRRTVQYGIDNHPELDKEAHWLRAVEHLKEKYGEGGYLKTILPESNNTANLKELRKLIADTAELRKTFDKLFSEEIS